MSRYLSFLCGINWIVLCNNYIFIPMYPFFVFVRLDNTHVDARFQSANTHPYVAHCLCYCRKCLLWWVCPLCALCTGAHYTMNHSFKSTLFVKHSNSEFTSLAVWSTWNEITMCIDHLIHHHAWLISLSYTVIKELTARFAMTIQL